MPPELSIKLNYLENRSNPAEVFEAMALYIKAYESLGQLFTNSIGLRVDFKLQLNDIEKGSILSKLSALSSQVDSMMQRALYRSGNKLFRDLVETNETSSEDQVEALAVNLEEALAENLKQQIVDPYIDRQNLAYVLSRFSSANEKIESGETVLFASGDEAQQKSSINTEWRFTGNPKEMFTGTIENKACRDNLYVTVSVNEGNSVWSFRSTTMDQKFDARITHKEWLTDYQNGLIPAIGPKDVVKADISYDIYIPPKGKGQPKIRNARIKKIVDIYRYNGHQYEL